jgi:small-conductance mechanosensitive channel
VAPWIPVERIDPVLHWDLLALCGALALGTRAFYSVFLKNLSAERHQNLKQLFRNLAGHFLTLVALFALYRVIRLFPKAAWLAPLSPYIGLAALFSGCIVLVKMVRIVAFEYLFLSNMRAGVPILLVNLASLFLSLVLAVWVLSGVFGFQLAPLLATSAIFSIVLGLALQDTLGNLIAGVALALDKPYEIGDWIEIQTGTQKWAGQVHEITWRATVLLAFTDEWITIPNRVVAQGHIANFSAKARPFLRSHVFHLRYDVSLERAKTALLEAAAETAGVRKYPAPLALLVEPAETSLSIKLVYAIDDYGRQAILADRVLERALAKLAEAGVEPAPPRLELAPNGKPVGKPVGNAA